MKVAKWGNSLALRLPAVVVEALALKEGDDIQVEVADSAHFAVSKSPSTADLLDRLHKYRGLIPADFKFDRQQANERG